MADGLPPRAQREALRLQTLVAGCRIALRDSKSLRWWLATHESELLLLLSEGRGADPDLIATLRQRHEFRDALQSAARTGWLNAPDHPDPAAISLTVELALIDEPHMEPGFNLMVEEFMAGCSVQVKAACYEQLLDDLRPHFTGPAEGEIRRSGWVYLLAAAAKYMLSARRLLDAASLLDEAWRSRHLLSLGTLHTVWATEHLAGQYAKAVGWAPPDLWPADPYPEVLRRIRVARDLLDAQADSVRSLQVRVRLGIAEAKTWYQRRHHGKIGYIAASAGQLTVLQSLESDAWRRLVALNPQITTGDYLVLPAELRPQFSTLLHDLTTAAHLLGHGELAERAAQDALALSDLPVQRVDARVSLAVVQRRLDDRLRQNEALLRDIEAGVLDDLTDGQRQRVRRRLHREHEKVAQILWRERKKTAAWFWSQIAEQWAPTRRAAVGPGAGSRPALPGAGGDGDGESGSIAPADATQAAPQQLSAGEAWLSRVNASIRQENALAVVLQLAAVSCAPVPEGIDPSLPEIRQGIVAVEAWWPPGRRPDPRRFTSDRCVGPEDVERAALELAGEFVKTYANHLGAQIFHRLAQRKDLPWKQRRTLAERAYAGALRSGRSLYAWNAQAELLELAMEHESAAAAEEKVLQMHETMRSALTSARGAADLIDLAKALLKKSSRAAGLLADRGYPGAAFTLASGATGLVRRMVAADPSVAEEFELVERRARSAHDDDGDALFELMRRRITGQAEDLGDFSAPELNLSDVAGHYASTVAFVQLLGAGEHGYWALGTTFRHGESVQWAQRLEFAAKITQDLRTTVWRQLRPRPQARTAVLHNMHELVVKPLLPHLEDTSDIVFVLHDQFAGLPLHAARSAEGYLVERHRVSYLPSPTVDVISRPSHAGVLVGGWDPSIDAGAEATDVAARFEDLGFDVTRPSKASSGRQVLLDSTTEWSFVHLAAHGDFKPWPESMDSRLRLSGKVSITAGEWLRSACRAEFVFLNSCTLGRHAPHAGDLNGFPLAMSARGTVATISALSPVPSEPARRFALDFYQHWTELDSLGSHQAACREAIRAGNPVSDWAPYLHTGLPMAPPRP